MDVIVSKRLIKVQSLISGVVQPQMEIEIESNLIRVTVHKSLHATQITGHEYS